MKFVIDNAHQSRYDTPKRTSASEPRNRCQTGRFLLPVYNCIPVRCKAHCSTFIATASGNAHRSDTGSDATLNSALCAFNPLRREP